MNGECGSVYGVCFQRFSYQDVTGWYAIQAKVETKMQSDDETTCLARRRG